MKRVMEKGFLGGSLLLFLLCAGWYLRKMNGEGITPFPSSEIEWENHPYLSLEPVARKEISQKPWKRPVRQSWDEKAIFEIFTPPIIYYKKTSHSFSLDPPLPSLRPNALPEMALIGINSRPYRFRFEGFAGEKDHFTVLLGNRESGTALRGRVGDRFAEEGIALQNFRVDRKLIHPENSALTPYWVESVVLDLFDERLQKVVSLGKNGHFPAGGEAHFRARDDKSELFLAKLGEPRPFGEFIYTLREINLVNRSVTVEKRSVGSKETITKTFFITP